MDHHRAATAGRLAIAIAIVAFVGLVFIALYYGGVTGPFGTLNDIFVALQGILSIALIWTLNALHRILSPRGSAIAFAIGLVGGILGPIGSYLVMSDITGWFLAGLVTTFGFACVGVWLLLLNYSVLRFAVFPRGLTRLGIVAGCITAVGLLSGPAILAGIDDLDTAGPLALTGLFVGGLGWNLLYPLWCFLLGRRLSTNDMDLRNIAAG